MIDNNLLQQIVGSLFSNVSQSGMIFYPAKVLKKGKFLSDEDLIEVQKYIFKKYKDGDDIPVPFAVFATTSLSENFKMVVNDEVIEQYKMYAIMKGFKNLTNMFNRIKNMKNELSFVNTELGKLLNDWFFNLDSLSEDEKNKYILDLIYNNKDLTLKIIPFFDTRILYSYSRRKRASRIANIMNKSFYNMLVENWDVFGIYALKQKLKDEQNE